MKRFAAALVLFVAFCFLGIKPATADPGWYEATVNMVGPISSNYYIVYLSSAAWSNESRNFTIYPTLNNTMTAIALTAMTSSRTVLVQLNSIAAQDYVLSMVLK